MPTVTRPLLLYLGLALVLLASGCARPPQVTEVEGTVLLNNEPLPNALVQFVPDLPGQEGSLSSNAVTDDKGNFRLVCSRGQEPGAVVGKHRVVITDAPPPAEVRGLSPKAQQAEAKYRAGLKNRPIPETYGSVLKTPLVIEVTPDKKTYTLTLTR